MAITIKHAFTSLKGDGTDATFVQPSSWNANHSFTSATGVVLGRLSAGAGNVEEISLSAQGAAILAAADASSYGFTTGDAKLTIKNVADTGWVLVSDGTIGSATSGATYAAADAQALFILLWNRIANTWCAVSGGRGASGAADFAANKTIALPKMLGRALAVSGAGASLTARALGEFNGAETHTLIQANFPNVNFNVIEPNGGQGHQHVVNSYSPSGINTNASTGSNLYLPSAGILTAVPVYSAYQATGIVVNSGGSSTPVGHLGPMSFLNVMVKL